MGIFALNDIYIKNKQMKPISDKIQALIDYLITEARKAPEPEKLSGFFNENSKAQFFSIVQRLKSGGDTEYDFKLEEQNGHKMIRDINKATRTKNCLADARFDTMIYGEQFKVTFGKCGVLTINNVVGVKLFADENALKNRKWMDSYELDTDLDKDETELIGQYYEMIKGVEVGEEVYFDSKFKWDGQVSDKRSNFIQVEAVRAGNKGQPINLNINLSQNPFYIKDGEIMFKCESIKREAGAKPTPFEIPIRKFAVSSKKKPKKEKPKVKKPEEMSDDEARSEAKIALDLILKDPLLKKAFYTQPSFLELLKAEMTGKRAVGKGIKPTLDLLNRYETRKADEKLGGDFFKDLKKVYYNVLENIRIPYTDAKGRQQTFERDKSVEGKYYGIVKPLKLGEEYRVVTNTSDNTDAFRIIIKKQIKGEPNVFLCDFVKVFTVKGAERKEIEQNIKIKFLKSEGYQPTKEKEQEPKGQFKNN